MRARKPLHEQAHQRRRRDFASLARPAQEHLHEQLLRSHVPLLGRAHHRVIHVVEVLSRSFVEVPSTPALHVSVERLPRALHSVVGRGVAKHREVAAGQEAQFATLHALDHLVVAALAVVAVGVELLDELGGAHAAPTLYRWFAVEQGSQRQRWFTYVERIPWRSRFGSRHHKRYSR